MRVGTGSGLATGEICTALRLAVVSIAMIIPGGDAVLGQTNTRFAAQVALFTAIDLTPFEFTDPSVSSISDGQQVGDGDQFMWTHPLLWHGSAASVVDLKGDLSFAHATGTCGGQQVGFGSGRATGWTTHALMWHSSAGSVVDLNTNRFDASEAHGTSGRDQVGFGILPTGGTHALLWRGSADSVVDLHPPGFASTKAWGTSSTEQVGWGSGPATGGAEHALLWRGSAGSVVDLHPRGFYISMALGTSGGQQVGYGSGPVTGGGTHALLWRGSATSVVDLNSAGLTGSQADGTNGEEQVGSGGGQATGGQTHALLWRGSAASFVDLHAFLPPGFVFSSAASIDAAGNVVGVVSAEVGTSHAILWKRNLPRPGASREQNSTGC